MWHDTCFNFYFGCIRICGSASDPKAITAVCEMNEIGANGWLAKPFTHSQFLEDCRNRSAILRRANLPWRSWKKNRIACIKLKNSRMIFLA